MILNFPLLIFLVQSEERREFQIIFPFPYPIMYNPGIRVLKEGLEERSEQMSKADQKKSFKKLNTLKFYHCVGVIFLCSQTQHKVMYVPILQYCKTGFEQDLVTTRFLNIQKIVFPYCSRRRKNSEGSGRPFPGTI